jgi:hypothetical protein
MSSVIFKTSLKKLYDLGERLGEKILQDGGSEADLEKVCERFGQYCQVRGIQDKHVDLFFQLYKQGHETLNMGMFEFARWIMINDYTSDQATFRKPTTRQSPN